MTESDQTELARERTYAAWLRTSLAFIVASIAIRHYAAADAITLLVCIILTIGGVVSADRALRFAPTIITRIGCFAIGFAAVLSAYVRLLT